MDELSTHLKIDFKEPKSAVEQANHIIKGTEVMVEACLGPVPMFHFEADKFGIEKVDGKEKLFTYHKEEKKEIADVENVKSIVVYLAKNEAAIILDSENIELDKNYQFLEKLSNEYAESASEEPELEIKLHESTNLMIVNTILNNYDDLEPLIDGMKSEEIFDLINSLCDVIQEETLKYIKITLEELEEEE